LYVVASLRLTQFERRDSLFGYVVDCLKWVPIGFRFHLCFRLNLQDMLSKHFVCFSIMVSVVLDALVCNLKIHNCVGRLSNSIIFLCYCSVTFMFFVKLKLGYEFSFIFWSSLCFLYFLFFHSFIPSISVCLILFIKHGVLILHMLEGVFFLMHVTHFCSKFLFFVIFFKPF